jgi:protein TonB
VAGVDAPILKTRVEPVYPEEARLARESGVVILEGIISPEGCVENLMLLKPTREPLLDAAAIRAVQQWEYAPALFEGRGVSVYLTITVNFQLH